VLQGADGKLEGKQTDSMSTGGYVVTADEAAALTEEGAGVMVCDTASEQNSESTMLVENEEESMVN
jgi:hypothetical protein